MPFHRLLGCAVLVAASLAAQAPNDPVAYWALDESSGTVASDSGPSGHTGALVGFTTPTWTTGQFGNCLVFNGASTYVNVTPATAALPIHNTPRHSVTAWVNGPAQGDRRIYSEGDSVNLNPLFTIGSAGSSTVTSAKLRVFVRANNGGNRVDAVSVANVFDGTWHHIAWVDNAGSGAIYVDGQLDSTWSYDVPQLTLSRVSLGAVLRATAGNYFSGSIDDFRIYPFCLTQPDVDAIRLSNATLANAFQLNQAAASLDLNNVQGSTATPAATVVAQGAPFTLRLSAARGGFPWELAGTTVLPVAGFQTFSRNIVNVVYTDPSAFFLNGLFSTTFGSTVTLPGFPPPTTAVTSTASFAAPNAQLYASLQFVIVDPASPDGFSASQPAQLTVN